MSRLWSLDDLRVLVAIYFNSDFSIGDDARDEARAIADAIGRSPASVDRQWRNVHAVLSGVPGIHVGQSLKKAVADHLAEPSACDQVAASICRARGWPLEELIRGEGLSAGPASVHPETGEEVFVKLRRFLDGLQFKLFKTGSQGFFRQGKIQLEDGRRLQAQATVVLVGSKGNPSVNLRADAATVAFEAQEVLSQVQPKHFKTGRTGFYGQGKLKIGQEKFQVSIQAVEIGSA